MSATVVESVLWIDVCGLTDIAEDSGVCALVDGQQVAIFRVRESEELFALSNLDPFSGAYVLSRGIVGSAGDIIKVSSPMYKQSFDLRTGQCLDDKTVRVKTFPVHHVGGRVLVCVSESPESLEGAESLERAESLGSVVSS